MLRIIWRIAHLYRSYWNGLGLIASLVTTIKIGDLVVPFLSGKVFEAVGNRDSFEHTMLWLAAAVSVWFLHGNVLPWVHNRIDAKEVDLFARRDISLWSLGRLKNVAGQDTAMLQTIVERGETVIPELAASITKAVLPSAIPSLVVVVTLIAISPLLFLVLAVGCGLYAAVTLCMNRMLMPCYAQLQQVDNKREQLRIKIFRVLAKPIDPLEDMISSYETRYSEVAKLGSYVRGCFFNFDLSRGVVINLMNACTWIIGIHAVRSGQFGLAVFIAFVSWSTACISYVQVATAFHKQWLESGPAMRNYFAAVDRAQRVRPEKERVPSAILEPAE